MTPPIAAEKILSDTAQVDSASVAPYPAHAKFISKAAAPIFACRCAKFH
jgi:hypothetical protein